jgi:hypothetical protein
MRITPIGTPAGTTATNANASVSPKDMMDIAKNMDKSLGVDSILNLVRGFAPDNTLVSQLIDAKGQANKGVSTYEARMMASDAAKAREADITKNVMDQMYKMKQYEQPQQAGFGFSGFNLQTALMLALGIGVTAVVMSRRSKIAA